MGGVRVTRCLCLLFRRGVRVRRFVVRVSLSRITLSKWFYLWVGALGL